MSSGLDTTTRRQIRKAFGADALRILDAHEQGLKGHALTLVGQDARLDRVERDTAAFVLNKTAIFHRGLWGRLSWLLRGR